MKIKRYESSEERAILTALIVNDAVLGRIYQQLGTDHRRPFPNKWSNLIAHWCFRHYAKYGKAPRKSIEGIFTRHAQTARDAEAVELIEKFLSHLDSDYRKLSKAINEDFILDQASAYFTRIGLERTVEITQAFLEDGELEEAIKSYSAYQQINFAFTDWAGFDADKIQHALRKRDQEEIVVRFPDALDKFLSPYFKRDQFIAFAGPDKRGKSYWLLEVVWRALRQRRKVIYYVFGDMSLDEAFQRLCVRMTKKPLTACQVRIPKRIKLTPDAAFVEFTTQKRAAMTLSDVIQARKKLLLSTAQTDISLRIKCEGGATVSASDIEQDVQQFAKQDFIPDVIVVDYADLLAPEPNTKHLDYRHQNNATWMILRRIALANHCLVVVATQTAATAYKARVIRKNDFSEDKRKNAHVTGMIGINQTSEEKEKGLYRLNWIVLRGGKWSESQVVWTASELALACPCFASAFPVSKNIKKR